ncbi:acyltransferase [Novosphingobium sp.]|uniref:acyltransferase family protein n=1 Tax=Novosphingobium sp. TaxID=1874826 RepID=UPI002736F228|nr:acyltransferase [Novosphingobium sp.]MDP3905801.1 acyltransferase [Novosphingobium sp.]
MSQHPVVRPNQSVHFSDLDGLRGLLALAVVLLHVGFNSFTTRTLGWKGFQFELSVDVFFLLSGFVLTYAARKGVNLGTFAVRRFLRLAPVFYASTLILIAVTRESVSPLELIMAVPFTGRDPVNFPAWSVCWELYLPVFAAMAWRAGLRIPDQAVRPLLIAALLALGYFDMGMAQGESNYPQRALFGLLAGHLLYRADISLPVRLEWPFAALVLVMGLATYWPVMAVTLPFIAILCIAAGRNGGSLFASAPMQLLGTLSYTLYLAHIPVLRMVQAALGEGADANPAAKVVVLIGSFALAWLLTIVIERPAMRISAQLVRAPVAAK